jgi:hypothetical protein
VCFSDSFETFAQRTGIDRAFRFIQSPLVNLLKHSAGRGRCA